MASHLQPTARWRARRLDVGTLEDLAPGGVALHALLPWEEQAVLDIVERWGTVNRSHRKLAHRGSYTGQVRVSPASVWRILCRHHLILDPPPARQPALRASWPDWLEWAPNRVWCWDATHFPRAKRAAFAIVDVVSRKWIATVVTAEESSTQVQLLFAEALDAEGLVAGPDPGRGHPLLLAMSDTGGPMISHATREFFAALAIAQRLGRPGTPADQAWTESLFGHVKADWPHLEQLIDPAVLTLELDRVRDEYNSIRLHAGGSATSPPTTSTKAGETPFARPAGTALSEPANNGSNTIAGTQPTPRSEADDLVHSKPTTRKTQEHLPPTSSGRQS